MEAEFYYGLSGTFKGTTIDKKRLTSDPVLWSEIKTWKSLENGIFLRQAGSKNDINYAMLHLCNLEQLIKNLGAFEICQSWKFFIERGITDMAYYYMMNTTDTNSTGDNWIREGVKRELEILHHGGIDSIHKILLIQKDEEFIKDVVLKESTRSSEFEDVQRYLQEQEQYIEFTKKYNNIDEVIEIKNAKEYIESLGLEYKLN